MRSRNYRSGPNGACPLIPLVDFSGPSPTPDFNPIELAFAKLKTHLRAAEARLVDPLVAAIGAGLDQISTDDIAGCYRHCGFALPQQDEQPS